MLTEEFRNNFNNNDDVELSPLSEQEWRFHISPATVFKYLSKLSSRKATGPDQVPPKLLKLGTQFLCFPLAEIFNCSIRTKVFPSCFKRALVCPVPKCSNPAIGNFRPICLLSSVSKVFERIVLDNVKSQLLECYGTHQHAYRPLGSMTTALAELVEHISQALDSNQTSHVKFFVSTSQELLRNYSIIVY